MEAKNEQKIILKIFNLKCRLIALDVEVHENSQTFERGATNDVSGKRNDRYCE
jgi:hypothetical protein